jgi:hypothetical protein
MFGYDPTPKDSRRGHTYALHAVMLESRRCPVCQDHELRPGQSVCSPRCRSQRWRDRRLADLQSQLLGLREQIDQVLTLLTPKPRRG